MKALSPNDVYKALPTPEILDARGTFFDIAKGAELWASGRDALRSVLSSEARGGKIHIPDYVCPSLPIFLSEFFEISRYRASPLAPAPDFGTLAARPGDTVLAISYFGASDGAAWRAWQEQNPGVRLIEDHSLAPFSQWASNSRADIAFASMRKTLPIPDGAWLKLAGKKPRAAATRPASDLAPFAAEILAAMALKTSQISCGVCDERPYRMMFLKGEEKLFRKRSISRISPYSFELLKRIGIAGMLRAKHREIAEFFEGYGKLGLPAARFIAPAGEMSAFEPVMAFESPEDLETVRKHFLRGHSRPTIYWNSDS